MRMFRVDFYAREDLANPVFTVNGCRGWTRHDAVCEARSTQAYRDWRKACSFDLFYDATTREEDDANNANIHHNRVRETNRGDGSEG